MDLNEALRIADILEQDDVISPVALACRTLGQAVLEGRSIAAGKRGPSVGEKFRKFCDLFGEKDAI